MQVISRRRRETINIGESVVVTVLGIEGGQVKLGVEAPREILVERGKNRNQGFGQVGIDFKNPHRPKRLRGRNHK